MESDTIIFNRLFKEGGYTVRLYMQGVPKKRGQNDMADQSCNKNQKSHWNMGSQTPVEGAITTRGRFGADTN